MDEGRECTGKLEKAAEQASQSRQQKSQRGQGQRIAMQWPGDKNGNELQERAAQKQAEPPDHDEMYQEKRFGRPERR
jgi:hypothetical protein